VDIDLDEIAYVPTTGVRHVHETALVAATQENLKSFGRLVDDPKTFPVGEAAPSRRNVKPAT